MKKIHLIFGNQDFLLKEKKEELVAKLLQKNFEIEKYSCRDFSGKEFRATREIVAQIVNSLNSPSLFSSQKLIILEQFELIKEISKNKEKGIGSFLLNSVLKTFKGFPPENNLILIAKIKNLKELPRNLVFSLEKSVNISVHKTQITYDNFKAIPKVLEMGEKMGISLSHENAELIVQFVGNDLMIIHSELEKIWLYSSDKNRPLESKELKKILGYSKSFDIFSLVKFLAEKNLTKTMECFDTLMNKQNKEAISVLRVLHSQIRVLLKISWMRELGRSETEIRSELQIPPIPASEKIREAKKFTVRELENILIATARLDVRLKLTGKNDVKLFKNFLFLVIKCAFQNQFSFSKLEF